MSSQEAGVILQSQSQDMVSSDSFRKVVDMMRNEGVSADQALQALRLILSVLMKQAVSFSDREREELMPVVGRPVYKMAEDAVRDFMPGSGSGRVFFAD